MGQSQCLHAINFFHAVEEANAVGRVSQVEALLIDTLG
jgi:hypothetical protein